jgi:hypothetical protein
MRAAQNMCVEISREQGVKVLRIESIRSHVIERKG